MTDLSELVRSLQRLPTITAQVLRKTIRHIQLKLARKITKGGEKCNTNLEICSCDKHVKN